MTEEKSFEADDTYEMPFGKYKGESLGAVPASYLIWFYEQPDSHKTRPLVYNYIKKNLKFLQKEADNDASDVGWNEDGWND